MKEETLLDLLCDAHMKGQMNAGCNEPSYSSARADCSDIAKRTIIKHDNIQRVQERVYKRGRYRKQSCKTPPSRTGCYQPTVDNSGTPPCPPPPPPRSEE